MVLSSKHRGQAWDNKKRYFLVENAVHALKKIEHERQIACLCTRDCSKLFGAARAMQDLHGRSTKRDIYVACI